MQQNSAEGKIHIYTGNGKSKTTAAIGICIRALGAGKKILWTQFVKGQEYNEIKIFKQFETRLVFKNFGRNCFINQQPEQADFDMAKEGVNYLWEVWNNKPDFDLIVFDELFIALYYQLISENEILNIIKKKQKHSELIITGRYAPTSIMAFADLVTEMQEIKHYYNTEKLISREGIEF